MQKKSSRYTMTKNNLIDSVFDTKPNSQWYINIDSKNPTIPFTPLTVRNTLRGLGLPLYQMDDFITLDTIPVYSGPLKVILQRKINFYEILKFTPIALKLVV